MKEITIHGGKVLSGSIVPSGSKNAALPIIFASIITNGVSVIENVPDIGDVRVAIKIIENLGAKVSRKADTLYIDTTELKYAIPDSVLTGKIRASSYLIGACLARFGIFHLSDFGGCNFCNRPIDMHLYAAELLGANIQDGVIECSRLRGNSIKFGKVSVGATINAIIMASMAKGESIIYGASAEPHVKTLVKFLVSAGADIEFGKNFIRVVPNPLHGGNVRNINDMIEAGTFLLLGPLTGGKVEVFDAQNLELDEFFDTIYRAGIDISFDKNAVSFSGEVRKNIIVSTAPHPGYPTDLQPQAASIMAAFMGGFIKENVWQNRFSYLENLHSFGLEYKKLSSDSVYIVKSKIKNAVTSAPDLRGGAAAVMCALCAKGESRISNSEIIERGYFEFIKKLASLGADIYDRETNLNGE